MSTDEQIEAALASLLAEECFPDFAYEPEQCSAEFLAELHASNLAAVSRAFAAADWAAEGLVRVEQERANTLGRQLDARHGTLDNFRTIIGEITADLAEANAQREEFRAALAEAEQRIEAAKQWAMANEIAAVPLDWASLGAILYCVCGDECTGDPDLYPYCRVCDAAGRCFRSAAGLLVTETQKRRPAAASGESGQVAVDRGAAQTDRHSAEPSARQGDSCGHPNHGNAGHNCAPFLPGTPPEASQ